MDHVVLFFILLIIWLVPFSFGAGNQDVLNVCIDSKYHKSEPGPESELYNQCKPWKRRSCCTGSTSEILHQPRHHNFNLDHCSEIKNMSDECRKHFIQDACFYECSPNVGPWIVDVKMKSRNQRFYQVPLCQSDCNVWYDACKHDYTCNGNWFRGWDWKRTGNQCMEGTRCQTFEEFFENASNFCEKVWDGSWKVTPDEEPCMRIWFDEGDKNPNDAVAKYYAQNLYNNEGSQLKLFNFIVTFLMIFFVKKLAVD